MSRTTSDLVKALLLPGRDYDLKQASDLSPFIDTASAMIDDVVSCISVSGGTALSASRLELIERWLAAHYFKVSDKGFSARSTEGASATFDGKTQMYLESTLYGQTAVRLDPSGCLSTVASDELRVAGAFWMGKAPSDQTPIQDRD